MSKTLRFLARRADHVKQNQRRRQESFDIKPETIEGAMAALLKATEAVILQAVDYLAGAVKALQASTFHHGGPAPAEIPVIMTSCSGVRLPAGDPVVPAILPMPEAIVPKPATPDPEEGGPCPTGCGGTLELPPVENCSCHINPPCSAHTNNKLTCPVCGWEEPAYEPCWPDTTVPKSQPNPWWEQWQQAFKRGHTFPHGGRVFEVTHDGSSGSTHVVKGKYEGPVTCQDIIDHFGDGTFGHRGPTLTSRYGQISVADRTHDKGTFTYTKITD